jgi:hypothetical protein
VPAKCAHWVQDTCPWSHSPNRPEQGRLKPPSGRAGWL